MDQANKPKDKGKKPLVQAEDSEEEEPAPPKKKKKGPTAEEKADGKCYRMFLLPRLFSPHLNKATAPPTEPASAKKPSGKVLEVTLPLRNPRKLSEDLEDELSQESDVAPKKKGKQQNKKKSTKKANGKGAKGKGQGTDTNTNQARSYDGSGMAYPSPCERCYLRDLFCESPASGQGNCVPCKVKKLHCLYRLTPKQIGSMTKKAYKGKQAGLNLRNVKSEGASGAPEGKADAKVDEHDDEDDDEQPAQRYLFQDVDQMMQTLANIAKSQEMMTTQVGNRLTNLENHVATKVRNIENVLSALCTVVDSAARDNAFRECHSKIGYHIVVTHTTRAHFVCDGGPFDWEQACHGAQIEHRASSRQRGHCK